MTDIWMVKTHGDTLQAIRQLLQNIWRRAGLDAMLVPAHHAGELDSAPLLVEDVEQLAMSDPTVPLMPVNSARLVAQYARQLPPGRYAAVLRSCESRALQEVVQREGLDLSGWLLIGIDCLASFPEEDFEWRVKKAGSVDELTRENLSHARQGVIAPHRYRHACQMCLEPEAQPSDLQICLLGLPLKEAYLVRAEDQALAARLGLDEITSGAADPALVAQNAHMLDVLNERRARAVERLVSELSGDLPADLDELLAQLESCAPCRECLEACPIYSTEVAQSEDGQTLTREGAIRWMLSCVSCGMCEQACPTHLPLPAIIRRVRQELQNELAAI